MTTFPDYVTILLEGYSETLKDNLIRTEMEDGVSKQRPRACLIRKETTLNILACSCQCRDDFLTWFKSLGQGSCWFLFSDPCTGNKMKSRFVNQDLTFTPLNTTFTKFQASLVIESLY